MKLSSRVTLSSLGLHAGALRRSRDVPCSVTMGPAVHVTLPDCHAGAAGAGGGAPGGANGADGGPRPGGRQHHHPQQ